MDTRCRGRRLREFIDNYAELGIDFMSGAGHKWQCGPGSTGILIVRNKVRTSNPTPLPPFFPVLSSGDPPTQPPGVKWAERATGLSRKMG